MDDKIMSMIEGLMPIKDRACEELKMLNKKEVLTPSDVQAMGMLIDVCKDFIEMKKDYSIIEAMEQEGYSSANSGAMRYSMLDDGYSMRRGRSPVTGQYVSRADSDYRYNDGYSGHTANDMMINALMKAHDTAHTEQERAEIRNEIERLRNR